MKDIQFPKVRSDSFYLNGCFMGFQISKILSSINDIEFQHFKPEYFNGFKYLNIHFCKFTF